MVMPAVDIYNCDEMVVGGGKYPDLLDYPQDGKIREKLDNLRSIFRERFTAEPQIFTRVPGRVNLIGEHVDYCGYSVCPMAIEQDIIIAASALHGDGDFLRVTNAQKDYDDHIFPERSFNISIESHGWAGYVLCGIKGAISAMKSEPVRMIMAVIGTVPPGSGLSSSSALVCAALLTTAHLNNVKIDKTELSELSATCERFIGMEGGGMDQAIAFLATKGCAKHIQFNPVRTEDVKLPHDAVFVIGHSLVTKNKAESSDYNTRVVECRLASQIIAKKCNLNWKEIKTVQPLQTALSVTLNEMMELINKHLRKEPYTKEEVCNELEVDEKELNSVSLTPNTVQLQSFKLHPRITHVVSEVMRVNRWLSEESLAGLGRLMIASHHSMRDLYEASHSACDRLVEDALAAGALGARITGAGWGGCVVALTTTGNVQKFLRDLQNSFYSNYQGPLDNILFKTEPQNGANLFKSNYSSAI